MWTSQFWLTLADRILHSLYCCCCCCCRTEQCMLVDANRQSHFFVCIFWNLVIGNLGSQSSIHKIWNPCLNLIWMSPGPIGFLCGRWAGGTHPPIYPQKSWVRSCYCLLTAGPKCHNRALSWPLYISSLLTGINSVIFKHFNHYII